MREILNIKVTVPVSLRWISILAYSYMTKAPRKDSKVDILCIYARVYVCMCK